VGFFAVNPFRENMTMTLTDEAIQAQALHFQIVGLMPTPEATVQPALQINGDPVTCNLLGADAAPTQPSLGVFL
jgi:hypothetical protein